MKEGFSREKVAENEEGENAPRKKTARQMGKSKEQGKDPRILQGLYEKQVDVPPRARERTEATVTDKQEQTTLEQRHRDWPQITVTIFFSAHGTDVDMAKIADHMPKADIYFYEFSGQDKITDLLQIPASNSDVDPEWALDALQIGIPVRGTIFEPIVRSLVDGKNRIIGNIDIGRDGDPISSEDLPKLRDAFAHRDYDDALKRHTRQLRKYSSLQEQREEIITQRFEEELETIFNANPELAEKDKVHILISMGAYHTSLADKMQSNGISVESILSTTNPVTISYILEAQRTFAQGEEPDPEILKKAYLESILKHHLRFSLKDAQRSDYVQTYLKRTASAFSSEEIKAIHALDAEPDWVKKLSFVDLNRILQEKGMEPLPRTNQDLERLVILQDPHVQEVIKLADYRLTH